MAMRAIYRLRLRGTFQVEGAELRMLMPVQRKIYIGNLLSGDTS